MNSVWIIGSKTFQMTFATREDADRFQRENGMNTGSLYQIPQEVMVISYEKLDEREGE